MLINPDVLFENHVLPVIFLKHNCSQDKIESKISAAKEAGANSLAMLWSLIICVINY